MMYLFSSHLPFSEQGDTQCHGDFGIQGPLKTLPMLHREVVSFLSEALPQLASGPNHVHSHNTSMTFVLDILQFLYLAEYLEIIVFSSCR